MPASVYPEVTFPRIAIVARKPGLDLRSMERALKLRLRRMEINADISAERASRPRNTLAGRTLQALPGEVFA